MLNLVTLVRGTRGQNSRQVEFQGIQTESPKLDLEGKPVMDSGTKKNPIEPPVPVMETVSADKLPSLDDILSGIADVLKNDAAAIALALSKTYNALAFSAAVEATIAQVVDLLSPIFAEFDITDDAEITKLRRVSSMVASQTGEETTDILRTILTKRAAKLASK